MNARQQARLQAALDAQPQDQPITTGAVHRAYRAAGIPGRRTARRDLAAAAHDGLLQQHGDTNQRTYSRAAAR
ncbi:hypothetical protein ACFV3R_25635 [Streptomyces sp. NPDC059740]|uniref:hypothetical protein n=1 Tax=Streptomyces sp. NPDC059740 TaxID=3346926 RepID=UPI0036567DAB